MKKQPFKKSFYLNFIIKIEVCLFYCVPGHGSFTAKISTEPLIDTVYKATWLTYAASLKLNFTVEKWHQVGDTYSIIHTIKRLPFEYRCFIVKVYKTTAFDEAAAVLTEDSQSS
jgi:hypothetical protein